VPEWSPELEVDAALAERLLGAQFPELALRSLRLVGAGWDNTVWRVDGRWVFRFPRRAIAVPPVARQVAVLPRLAPFLPLAIPEPAFVGRPADGYPWPFFGAAFLPGSEVADASLTDDQRGALARPLARFLGALHGIPPADAGAAALPVDPMGRADMAQRVPRAAELLAEVESLGLWSPPTSVGRLFEAASTLPPPDRLTVAHADLHLRHLLVDDEGKASAVIDWDDLCRADPSIDLVLVWAVLPPEARLDFLDAYGPVSDLELLRARVLAFFLCAVLAKYAAHERLSALQREAVASLARAARD
jgi:aminoglycoside phosphotransferase (APT) family kinase protein